MEVLRKVLVGSSSVIYKCTQEQAGVQAVKRLRSLVMGEKSISVDSAMSLLA